MAPSTVEEFVLKMVQAALRRTGLADLKLKDLDMRLRTHESDPEHNKGTLTITFLEGREALAGDVVAEYETWRDGPDWQEGSVAVYLASLPKHRHEYFCTFGEDELRVFPIEVLHRRRALGASMHAFLHRLGHRRSAESVGRQLEALHFSPDVDGLCQAIGYVNDVMTNFQAVEQPDGSWRYVIEGGRSDDWGVWGTVRDLPSGIIALAKKFPDQVLVIPLEPETRD